MSRILLVEDEESLAYLATMILEGCGYSISHARSGEEALTMMEHSKPDLLLTDNMMPGMDGIDLCRRLREKTSAGNIPIIMLSASPRPDEAGDLVDAFLRKPFTPERLIVVVRRVLGEAGSQHSAA